MILTNTTTLHWPVTDARLRVMHNLANGLKPGYKLKGKKGKLGGTLNALHRRGFISFAPVALTPVGKQALCYFLREGMEVKNA